MIKHLKLACIFSLFTASSFAGEIFDRFPETINPDEKYVFYSHGYGGLSPTIKKAISDPDYNLIVYERTPYTNPKNYSANLAAQINELISHGVKPENITLLGFSDGGVISILTSLKLKNDNINVIILAGCAGIVKVDPSIEVYGHVYSIYDNEDVLAGSCQYLIDRSKHNKSFTELAINTGEGHTAFKMVLTDWIEPVKRWINSNP